MTDRELMQQALDALEKHVLEYETAEALRARLAQPDLITPADVEQLARIEKLIDKIDPYEAQPEPEPVAWMHDSHVGFNVPLYTAPPHFIDPAKVARLMDEAFERGKKEIDMEQVKDIAQKLADCALLNSAPPQREWQGLTDEEYATLMQHPNHAKTPPSAKTS